MDSTQARLLEEWKATNDLLKFYEDLKQKRFAHFLTIQTAFLAFFGLLAKDALGTFSMVTLSALVIVSVPPLFIAIHFLRVDARSRAFVDTANTRLLLIEDEWAERFPDNHFSTSHQLFGVLSRRDDALIARYVAARNIENDPFRTLVTAKSAHASEHAILRLFWWLWIILLTLATVVHLGWHLIQGFAVTA